MKFGDTTDLCDRATVSLTVVATGSGSGGGTSGRQSHITDAVT